MLSLLLKSSEVATPLNRVTAVICIMSEHGLMRLNIRPAHSPWHLRASLLETGSSLLQFQ